MRSNIIDFLSHFANAAIVALVLGTLALLTAAGAVKVVEVVALGDPLICKPLEVVFL